MTKVVSRHAGAKDFCSDNKTAEISGKDSRDQVDGDDVEKSKHSAHCNYFEDDCSSYLKDIEFRPPLDNLHLSMKRG